LIFAKQQDISEKFLVERMDRNHSTLEFADLKERIFPGTQIEPFDVLKVLRSKMIPAVL
jgi:hypothetical protein